MSKNNKKIGCLLFEQHRGKTNLGSSIIRGHWLLNHWGNAELFKQGEKYDVIVYQKAYFPEHAQVFDGVKIFDMCDADFLQWGYKTKEMFDAVDIITTSTKSLAETVKAFTNKKVICIPDRIDLDLVRKKGKKEHYGKAKWVVWYGYSHNFEVLQPVLSYIKKENLGLIVISDHPFNPQKGYEDVEIINYPHNWDTVYSDIIEGDFVINPQKTNGKWKYKSNNKTLLAWALGMPVAEDVEDFYKFLKEENRKKEVEKRDKELDEKWDVKLSVKEMEELIEEVIHNKKNE